MMLFWKLGIKGLIGIVVAIALLSFASSEWAWRHYPVANFYLLVTRAWELMIGSLVAFYLFNSNQPQGVLTIRSHTMPQVMLKLLPQLGSVAGFVLILTSIFLFDEGIPFPSIYALVPTIGTALIILFATPETLVFKILSARVFVGIGLISYSAYLWHQPLFAFAKILSFDEPQLWLITSLIIATFGLAYLSWCFVEKPFRDRQRFNRKQIFNGALFASLTFIMIGFGLMFPMGLDIRLKRYNV